MTARDADRSKVALAVLVREMQENLPAHLEFAKLTSKLQRARYLALIAEGFNDRQALELCK